MTRHSVAGKVVAITGAAAGIGRALAVELSHRGAIVACSDLNQIGLQETVALCAGKAKSFPADVADRSSVEALAAAVVAEFGSVHQVYNIAGVALNSKIVDSSWEDYERILRINLAGVIHGTRAFLPHLIASGDGHVVNMSSLNGIFAQPFQSHYCASKFAVRGFTEALRAEMLLDRYPVRVSVVHPGGVATAIAQNGLIAKRSTGASIKADEEQRTATYSNKLLKLPPARAAQIIADGVEKGRPRIMVGSDAVMTDMTVRLLPAQAPRLAVAFERWFLKTK